MLSENRSFLHRLESGRFALLGAALTLGLLFAWPSRAEAVAVYYSIGTSAANLMTAGTNITIAAGVATFDRAQPNNVGVGDEILYGAATAYISGRASSTQYSVITRVGVAPGNVTNVAVTSIKRAFNLLSTAEANSSNASHLNTTNLVGGNFQLNWPCYDDGVMNDIVAISGYSTGPTNYIRAYTPTSSAEVGVSQRHRGVFGTGFQINRTNGDTIQIFDAYVRIEGLTIQATVTTTNWYGGIQSFPAGVSDVRISHNIIKGVVTAGNQAYGIMVGTNAANVHRVWNNVVYNFPNTTAETGIGIDIEDGIGYVFNNTVYNCQVGITRYSSVAGSQAKNNVSINDVFNAAYTDYLYLGSAPAVAQSNNVSSDATAAGAGSQTGKTAYATYFTNTTPGTEDFHLTATSLSLWGSNGADLSADANLPVTNDIDLGPRLRPDIGADELTALAAYYSVGTAAGPLYSANAQATSGTLTLASAAANNVGVGDEVRRGADCTSAPCYYITGRLSPTVFTIQNSAAFGGTPGATNITFASTAITIRRAFNLLSTAEANSSDANHLNTANLVNGNFQLNWPCYNDAPMNNQVSISGYTTSAVNFIKVYTPVFAHQVGVSQRHTGKARTGFRLQPTSAVDSDSIRVFDSFVRVEGIEIDGSLSTAPNGAGGVSLETAGVTPVEHYVSHNIIYETRNFTGIYARSMSARVWDNVCHRCNNTNATLGAVAMDQAGGTGYFYNNTVYDHAGHGFDAKAGTMIATNNVSMKPGGGFFDFLTGAGTLTQSRNVSSDATAAGAGSQINMTTYASYFQSTTVGSEDLHLKRSSFQLWGSSGTNLSADPNLAVTNDIDLGARVRPDIGADEFTAIPMYRSVGITATQLASGAGNALTIAGSTATFAVALPNNVGVGDAIPYDASGDGSIDSIAFIHGRTSSQSYTVKNAQGTAPTPVAGDNDWRLFRAYTRLANWASQTENTNIDAAVRDFDTSTDLPAAGAIMYVACYADGADPAQVTINGWTTSSATYIDIFTPVLASQVGTSQRHNGAWDPTKYRLVGATANNGRLVIADGYVRVTGLQIENTALKASQQPAGIRLNGGNAVVEARLSHNILRATDPGVPADAWTSGIVMYPADGTVLKAWNNVIYDWGTGIKSEYALTTDTVILYNNTIINNNIAGIQLVDHPAGTYRLANNLVQGAATNYGGPGMSNLDYSAGNLSQDTTSPQVPLRSKVVTFVGAPDYHLNVADANAKDQGTTLSADPFLAVFDDIDGQVRTAPWDIGADDASGTTAVKLMSFEAVAGGRGGRAAVADGVGARQPRLPPVPRAVGRPAPGRGSRRRSSPGSARPRSARPTPSGTPAS